MAAKFETVQRLQEGLQGKVGMCASFIMIIIIIIKIII